MTNLRDAELLIEMEDEIERLIENDNPKEAWEIIIAKQKLERRIERDIIKKSKPEKIFLDF